MKRRPSRPATVFCVLSVTAALAAEPTPAHAGKVVTHIGTKGSAATQQRTPTIPEAAQQIWRRRTAIGAKDGGQGILGRSPAAHAGGVHGVAAVAAPPYGASPLSGASTNTAGRGSGTDLHVKGAVPAVIHPAAKTGTGPAGRNR